jgi:hypothetical protein
MNSRRRIFSSSLSWNFPQQVRFPVSSNPPDPHLLQKALDSPQPLVAIFFQEADWEAMADKVLASSAAGIGAPTLAETANVLSARMKSDTRALLSRFLTEGKRLLSPSFTFFSASSSEKTGCEAKKPAVFT